MAFDPRPLSQAKYDVAAPSDNPALQQHFVRAKDGVRLYVESYLPKAKDGEAPPKRVPTILVAAQYEAAVMKNGGAGEGHRKLWDTYVPHGYAVSFFHLRGTGKSGGCFNFFGPTEQDDVARVIEYLGRDAKWTNGKVGMSGPHSEGAAQYAAATSPDRARVKYLKAIAPMAGVRNYYDLIARDGVAFGMAVAPVLGNGLGSLGSLPETPPGPEDPQRALDPHDRGACAVERSAGWATDGSFTEYWQQRELRRGASRVTAAVLFTQGLQDIEVGTTQDVGFIDRLPATTPLAGLVGQWESHRPDEGELHAGWHRVDWNKMERAWFDRYLMNLPTGVEDWPRVQVQDMSGQWREEPTWPTTGGPVGQLALGANGSLGATGPSPSSTYREVPDAQAAGVGMERTGAGIVFETDGLDGPLHLTGQPSLELWVQLERPEAHLTATLDVLDGAGKSLLGARVYGLRSARHLEPFKDGRFEQAHGSSPPVGQPFPVTIRLTPVDVTVPTGGKLRLSIGGSTGIPIVEGVVAYSEPSGSAGEVKILHDCDRMSMLRFLMPRENSPLLNVSEPDDTKPVTNSSHLLKTDGEGLATAPVCGAEATRDEVVGPARKRGKRPLIRRRSR